MVKTAKLSREDFELLRKYDSPTVCNVIELFEVRPKSAGYMDGRIKCCFPEFPPMVGYASTATFKSTQPARDADPKSSVEEQLETFAEFGGPIVPVIQDLDDPPASACFGDMMCLMYQTFGAVGIVTSGAGRDLEQVKALGFPAFVGSTICSHGYNFLESINVPIRVGGITVRPGDLLFGDTNGITTIPLEIASEVAHVCGEYARAEKILLDYLKSQSPTIAGAKEALDECRSQIGALRERLSRKG